MQYFHKTWCTCTMLCCEQHADICWCNLFSDNFGSKFIQCQNSNFFVFAMDRMMQLVKLTRRWKPAHHPSCCQVNHLASSTHCWWLLREWLWLSSKKLPFWMLLFAYLLHTTPLMSITHEIQLGTIRISFFS